MPPQEQAELWMALRDRMKTNWAELTLQEKKAGMSFLPYHQLLDASGSSKLLLCLSDEADVVVCYRDLGVEDYGIWERRN